MIKFQARDTSGVAREGSDRGPSGKRFRELPAVDVRHRRRRPGPRRHVREAGTAARELR